MDLTVCVHVRQVHGRWLVTARLGRRAVSRAVDHVRHIGTAADDLLQSLKAARPPGRIAP